MNPQEQIQEAAKLNRIMMDFSRYLWNKGYVNFGKVDYSQMLVYGDEFMKEHGKSYSSQQEPVKGVEELQRYDIYGTFDGMGYGEKSNDGEWVKFEDVEKLLPHLTPNNQQSDVEKLLLAEIKARFEVIEERLEFLSEGRDVALNHQDKEEHEKFDYAYKALFDVTSELYKCWNKFTEYQKQKGINQQK